MSKKRFVYAYPRPAVTADAVIVTREPKPRVLLIRRKHAPFAGKWALPGGFMNMDETLEAAARRELLEETGVRAEKLEQLQAFDEPDRDPRDRIITVAFLGRIDPDEVTPEAADDAAETAWFPLDRLPPLAFDHKWILRLARERLKGQRTLKRSRKRA
ncbi:MAG: NUDIX hydrolase [Planctomycetes bacterium]|nr:NUDIX hydrolase [Planctomycetota bacterium]